MMAIVPSGWPAMDAEFAPETVPKKDTLKSFCGQLRGPATPGTVRKGAVVFGHQTGATGFGENVTSAAVPHESTNPFPIPVQVETFPVHIEHCDAAGDVRATDTS